MENGKKNGTNPENVLEQGSSNYRHVTPRSTGGIVNQDNPTGTKDDPTTQSQVLSQTVYSLISNKQYTAYDFHKVLVKAKQTTPLGSLSLEGGLNVLQACIDKGRLTYLPVLVILGWWKPLVSQKVPQDSGIREHKGRTAKQIAESKKTRKPLDEYNINNEWEQSLSPLMKSCRSGDVLKARQLLQSGGVEIFHLDSKNGNALFWAVVSGNLELFRNLVDMGLDAKMRTKHRETLLHLVCAMGHHLMVPDLVLKYKIDPWLEDTSNKACHDRIAENGDIETLKEFVKCGVHPKSNVAALAAFAGRSPYLVYLFDVLDTPVDATDLYDRTALHRSLEAGHFGLSKYLVQKGADVTKTTKMGRNVLHIIAEEGNAETMKWMISVLKSKGCFHQLLDVQDRYNGVDLCFLIRGRDKGRDAFHYVEVHRSKVPLFKKRTQAGNVDVAIFGTVIKSGWGVNPDQDTVDEIEDIFKARRLNRSAELDQTPLLIAMAKSKFDLVKLLIEHGADIHIADKFGQTPVLYAVSRGSLEMVSLLEKKGADLNVVDNSGNTIAQIADDNEHSDIINFLSGRSSFDLVENFRAGPLQRLNRKINHDELQRQRGHGVQMKQYLTECFREITTEINQLLVKLDSGPVLEETGGESGLYPGGRTFHPPGSVSDDSGVGLSVFTLGSSTQGRESMSGNNNRQVVY